MKKTNTFRWLVALFVAIFIVSNSAMAQIKIVGDDYSNELTGSKSYYDRDVDFEKYFPSVSYGQNYPFSSMYRSIAHEYKTNLVGDTIYLCEPLSLDITDCNTSHSFKLLNGKATCGSFVMPSGYYLISGYVFCDDNEDTLRLNVGLKPLNGTKTSRELKKEILKYGNGFDFYKDFLEYQRLLALKPLNGDTVTTYYLYFNTGRYGNINSTPQTLLYHYSVLQRFYNQITNFIGKEVYRVKHGSTTSGNYGKLEIIDEDIIDDGITGDPVKLEDIKFTVQDVVLKKDMSGKYNTYIVLKGEKTGTFTQIISSIRYAFYEEDLDYYDRDEPNIIKDIPILDWGWSINIIKCSDLKKIKQRTKELQAQKEREIKQQKAKKEAELSRQMVALYGAEFGELIAKKQVSVGMTREMCKAAWGFPMNTYRTTTRFGQSEVWCYNYKTKVYFFEGKVVKIDD